MAFGQQAGPPASAKQVQELLALVQRAGHADFRDARGAMGLTQRQAAGKFTRDEAQSLIDALEQAEHDGDGGVVLPAGPTRAERKEAAQVLQLHGIPSDVLAGELQRRGWVVMAP